MRLLEVLGRRSAPVRPFYLYRREDVSGVSGTGVVAVGVVLPSGRCVLEWCSRWPTLTVFDSIREIEAIHGHGGRSRVRFGTVPSRIPLPGGKKGGKAGLEGRLSRMWAPSPPA